ncbi:MAG: cbb3-type cytochrome c oxidase subunit I [Symbiobacteriia bacterium]
MALPERWFERAALVFLASAGLLGVFLRTKYVYPGFLTDLTFGNLLHGHSHTMFFGWVALALSGLIYRELGRLQRQPLWGRRLIALQWWGTVAATTVAMFSFSLSGYSPLSIVMATVNMLLWYVATAVIWRNTPVRRPVWVGFYRAAAFYLTLSTLGTWTLTVLEVTGRARTPFLSTAPVYFYLSNYIDGWAVLGVTGLIYQQLAPRLAGRGYSPALAELQLKWQVVLTLPAYLHYLAGFAEVPAWVHVLGTLFTVALLVPAVMFLYNLRGLFSRSRQPGGASAPAPPGLSRPVLALLRWAVLYAGLKAVAEAISVLPGLAALVYGTAGRQWVVVGLHTTLFGVVTFGLLAAVLAAALDGGGSRRPQQAAGWVTLAVQGSAASLALMLAFLTLAALGPLLPPLAARYALWFQGAWVASLFLWVLLTVLAAVGWGRQTM